MKRKHVFDDVNIRIWWRGYACVMMWMYVFGNANMYIWLCYGTGTMNRSPTPDGMFATNFVECFVCISLVFVDFSWCVRCIIAIRQQCFGKPFAAKWQTVSSRRGRFIVPAYMKTPTKWQTEMCVWWCGNAYLIMWKHVFDNVDMLERFTTNRRIP